MPVSSRCDGRTRTSRPAARALRHSGLGRIATPSSATEALRTAAMPSRMSQGTTRPVYLRPSSNSRCHSRSSATSFVASVGAVASCPTSPMVPANCELARPSCASTCQTCASSERQPLHCAREHACRTPASTGCTAPSGVVGARRSAKYDGCERRRRAGDQTSADAKVSPLVLIFPKHCLIPQNAVNQIAAIGHHRPDHRTRSIVSDFTGGQERLNVRRELEAHPGMVLSVMAPHQDILRIGGQCDDTELGDRPAEVASGLSSIR
jgi:hypothetical protein